MSINYQGKIIVIVGLGLTGLSCIKFFLERGVAPRVMDTRINPPGIKKIPKNIKCHFGSLNSKWLLVADLIIISPGISLLSYNSLIDAENSGVKIIGDIELFCLEAKAPIIAITGSNGKSTVTALVGEIAKLANVNVGIGGNIGYPALTILNSSRQLYVLELSSFQLEVTTSLQAAAATVLNISEDHLDRYPFGFQQYSDTKLRIYKNAKACIFNKDNKLKIPFNLNSSYISFGSNFATYHLSNQNNEKWLCIKGKKVLNVDNMKIFGQHNYINALASLALADAVGLPRTSSILALKNFKGLPHRFQLILENNGVRWINDSKSTNVHSTKAAIKTVLNELSIDGTLYLLLGGDGKSANFLHLKPYLKDNKIRIYCFGLDKDKLASLHPENSEKTETMEQAVFLLSKRLKSGDLVLLSPACSSLDQFKNFEQRGNIFTNLAKKLG